MCSAPGNKIKYTQLYPTLKFTSEMEQNNKLYFLDPTLIKHNDQIHTTWYSKQMHSGWYLNYLSLQFFNQKRCTVTGLTVRAMNLLHHTYTNKH